MDKVQFFSAFAPQAGEYPLPDGQVLPIRELTLGERGRLHKAAESNPIQAQALIVAMGCELFDENDIEQIQGLPGDLVSGIADAILDLSGLGGDAEKNS